MSEMKNATGTTDDAREHAASPAIGHETSDVRVQPIALLALGLALLTLLAVLITWGLFGYFFARSDERVEMSSPFSDATLEGARSAPPTEPEEQLRRLREHEERMLEGYGWVDREAGTARIPLERAMEILVGRGGAEERRDGGAEERRGGGAEERRDGGAEERRDGDGNGNGDGQARRSRSRSRSTVHGHGPRRNATGGRFRNGSTAIDRAPTAEDDR